MIFENIDDLIQQLYTIYLLDKNQKDIHYIEKLFDNNNIVFMFYNYNIFMNKLCFMNLANFSYINWNNIICYIRRNKLKTIV